MGVAKRVWGNFSPWILKFSCSNFSKKGSLRFEWVKCNFTTLEPPGKILSMEKFFHRLVDSIRQACLVFEGYAITKNLNSDWNAWLLFPILLKIAK